MSKLAIFRRQASVGSTVTLRLTRGDDVTGRIIELDDSHVRIDRGNRVVTIFEDILAGWEVHAEPSSDGPQDATEPTSDGGNISEAPATVPSQPADSIPAGSLPDYNAIEALARIKATFTEATGRANLAQPEPRFELTEQEFPTQSWIDIRKQLDRARDQYHNALKIRELNRLNTIVIQTLKPLVEKHSASISLHALLAGVLLKLDRKTEAVEHLRFAALSGGSQDHWYALAFSSKRGSGVECLSLRNFFLQASPEDAREAWFRYLAIALDHNDVAGLIRVFEKWFQQQEDNDLHTMLAESLVYAYCCLGEQDTAQEAVSSLINNEPFPPEGWRSILERANKSPSDELIEVEKEFAWLERKQTERDQPKRLPDVPRGSIASFGSQRFGFIDGENGQSFFFRIDDVVDDTLKQSLIDGVWRSSPQVEFQTIPSPGHKYQRAIQIMPLQDTDALLRRARQLVQMNQHPQAIALVRRVLATSRDHSEAVKLETEIRDQIRSQGIGLPKGTGPYARAKRAQFLDQDISAAESFFRLAMEKGDKTEAAVKDLASLLQQQRRFTEAISLLESKRRTHAGASPYDNMLATAYQQSGHHEKAVELLKSLAKQATRMALPSILRRLAFSYYKSAQYDEAERTLQGLLREKPDDRTAERWLTGLEEAKRIGSYADAEDVIEVLGSLVEEGMELTPLARAAIETCTFELVEPSKLISGTLTVGDAKRLEDRAKNLGTRLPRERAACYLSAAAILHRLSSETQSAHIYDYLRRHFASMGDGAWVDKRPAEVVRTYYLESLMLVSDPQLDEAWRTLVRYIATFNPDKIEQFEGFLPRTRRPHSEDYLVALQSVIRSVKFAQEDIWSHALLEMCSQSGFAQKAILDTVMRDEEIRAIVSGWLKIDASIDSISFKKAWDSKCNLVAKDRQHGLSICHTLRRHQMAAASMEDLAIQLRRMQKLSLGDLDRRRVVDLLDIAESAMRFCTASDFEDKEQHYWLVTTRAKRFGDDVRSAPTQFSFDGLLPVSEHLLSLTEEEYAQVVRTSAAELDLRLLVESYCRSRTGEVCLQVEVANREGCSPASSVRLLLGPPDSPYFEAPHSEHEVASAVRGGMSTVSHVLLRLLDRAKDERAFPVKIRGRYRNRVGEDCWTEEREWTVRLYGENEFQSIANCYAPYAEGGAVDDPQMFVGRSDLLTRLEIPLLSGSGSKCMVVFGQKRAGKSSILEHLKRRLFVHPNCLPVAFSLQDIAPFLNEASFFYRILQGISDSIEELRYKGEFAPEFVCPKLEDLQMHPTIQFHEAMSALIRQVRHNTAAGNLSFVVLIDEFTDIYKQIKKGVIAREFMKAWKSIIEKRYFASVLVGQDILPAFKEDFPNEFGVTEDVRVTYLSDTDARKLVEEPVGSQRYAGKAVDRLLGLTAGSPYYTMMLCSRLVDYMNRTRSAIVTEADIATVEKGMLQGEGRLTRDKFDNLLCAGDGFEDSGIDPEETFRVCLAIAQGSDRGWCPQDFIRKREIQRLDFLLADLERRDVIERKGDGYRLIVGLFRDWLLLQR